MKDIHDILSNYEEQPPTNCWEKLSGRLDAIMPQSEGAASSASAAAKGATTTLTKAIIASVIGIVTVSTITLVVLTPSKKDSPVNNMTTNSTCSDTPTDSSVIRENEHTSSYMMDSKSTASSRSISNEEETPVHEATPIFPIPSSPSTIEQATSLEGKQAIAKANPAIVPHTITPAKPTISEATLPQSSTIIQNHKNDPVVQNLSEEENVNWNPPAKIEIPNVFTPNGDGYNDYFVIKGIESCSKRQLIVRNRSGKIVFRSNNYESNWNGEDCPDGTYTYQFFFSSNGIEQNLNGTVNIIRK